MTSHLSLSILIFITVLSSVSSNVVNLNANNFEDTHSGTWLVEFFTPWCDHCKNLEPVWKDLAIETRGRFKIAKVDCTQHENLCKENGATAYPTIVKYVNGKAEFYGGSRTVDSFVDFLEGKVEIKSVDSTLVKEDSGDVIVLNDANYASKTATGTWFIKFYAPWCGHCTNAIPAWKELARLFHDEYNVAKIDCTVNMATCTRLSIMAYPTFKLLVDGESYDHTGEFSVEGWDGFFRKKSSRPSTLAYDKDVIFLTDEDFDKKTSKDNWFISFYAPWCTHCKTMAPDWGELATKSKDKFHVAKVDCTMYPSICNRLGITGYPTLQLFLDGYAHFYNGDRTIQGYETFYKRATGDNSLEYDQDIALLNDFNFEANVAKGHWFIKFYAPWCGHCKSMAPTWDEFAEAVKDDPIGIKVGKVDCTVDKEICAKYEVQGYPTLKLFVEGGKVFDFKGDRTADAFEKFAKKKIEVANQPIPPVDYEGDVAMLNDFNFEHNIGKGVWFVKFYAPWCGHCKSMAPTWSDYATKVKGEYNIAKVDCTVDTESCSQFGVTGYPTLKLFVDGTVYDFTGTERNLAEFEKFYETRAGKKSRRAKEDL